MTREGKRIRTPNLEVRYVASHLRHARVAIVVPRHRRKVVERNRVRRVLREHLRLFALRSLPPIDMVIRAGAGAYATPESDLRSELSRAMERLGAGNA